MAKPKVAMQMYTLRGQADQDYAGTVKQLAKIGYRAIQVSGFGNATPKEIRKVMDDHPITCTPETDVNEVRRMMLEHHVRYLPVLESRALMGVISFYDVAKAVVEEQGFENRMLKAYIRDWPEEEQEQRETR